MIAQRENFVALVLKPCAALKGPATHHGRHHAAAAPQPLTPRSRWRHHKDPAIHAGLHLFPRRQLPAERFITPVHLRHRGMNRHRHSSAQQHLNFLRLAQRIAHEHRRLAPLQRPRTPINDLLPHDPEVRKTVGGQTERAFHDEDVRRNRSRRLAAQARPQLEIPRVQKRGSVAQSRHLHHGTAQHMTRRHEHKAVAPAFPAFIPAERDDFSRKSEAVAEQPRGWFGTDGSAVPGHVVAVGMRDHRAADPAVGIKPHPGFGQFDPYAAGPHHDSFHRHRHGLRLPIASRMAKAL